MFLISLFFVFFLNKKPNSISYLCYFLVKLYSLYSVPLKYFYTKILSHVEQTYIKEVMVIYRMKIDAGQNKETYQVSREAMTELKCKKAVYRKGGRDRLQRKSVKTLLGH